MNNKLIELNKVLPGIRFEKNVPMKEHTSFRIGGHASLFYDASSVDELSEVLNAAAEIDAPYCVIGNGTNLLVADSGIDALVIHIGDRLSGYEHNGESYSVMAGTKLASWSKRTVEDGYMGMEWAAGIPGSVGGAVAMNAGAYGGEIADRIVEVTYISNGEIKVSKVLPEDLGYRFSVYKAPEAVVVSAKFILEKDDGLAVERMAEFNRKRISKQPLSYPSAGSVFKRPDGFFAGKLIEDAGLKGFSVGGAEVSRLHAGFIVNKGEATADDVYRLIQFVREKVFETSGVMLEPEVKFIGKF